MGIFLFVCIYLCVPVSLQTCVQQVPRQVRHDFRKPCGFQSDIPDTGGVLHAGCAWRAWRWRSMPTVPWACMTVCVA
eukprot:9103155-Pyramimonas_sp.AAC.1